VVVTFGLTPASYHQIHRRFGNWFDLVPHFHRDHYDFAVWDEKTTGMDPETFLAWGFFDGEWRLDPQTTYRAVPAFRQDVRPYVAPDADRRDVARIGHAVAGEGIRLQEIVPLASTVAKNCVERGRSQRGGPLLIRGERCENGISLTFPARISFPCKGFGRLRADFGIQWDGQEKWSAARENQSRASMEIRANGRLVQRIPQVTRDQPVRDVEVALEGAPHVTIVIAGGPPWGGGELVIGNASLVP
jgi:hypothetical protein